MFESISKERTLKDIVGWLFLPVVVAVMMDIPLEIDLYKYSRVPWPNGPDPHFYWLYFHALIVGALSFGPPSFGGVPVNGGPFWWPTFLTKDENSWAMTVVNITFYALLTVWCRYSIMEGFTVGFDAADFRRYRPLTVGIVLLALGCLGLSGVAIYDRFPPDMDSGFMFYVLAYSGVIFILLSIIIVTGRRIRLRRSVNQHQVYR